MARGGPHASGSGQGSPRTITMLFADIEGSTRLLADLGDDYEHVLAGYYEVIRGALRRAGGTEVGTEGDGFFAVLDRASAAVQVAADVQRDVAEAAWPDGAAVRVRMGLHTGEAVDGPGGPVGMDVHRAARIAAVAHGGQVLLSDSVRALTAQHLPDGLSLRDLGVHRLKDLSGREHLYQLAIEGLPSDFPALRTLDAAPHNLPAELASFVGREADVRRACDLLRSHRLITLTGPGGTGKTRLALQVAAAAVGDFPGGTWFVELAAIRDPELLAAEILRTIQVREAPSRDPREQLLEHLRGQRTLLVLDNFEQVLAAAELVGELLREAPELRVVVTSRAALRVSGEQELPVPPLALPDRSGHATAEVLSQYEAVALFIERATAVRPDFTVTNDNAPAVAELVWRLDGLPLAIELAAARVRLLTPEAMLERLERLEGFGAGARDLPQRQRTLRSTIAWSYDLLGDDERCLLARLAVFVDGWTLQCAEAVCGDDLDVLEATATLVEHSLVVQREQAGEPRFRMLETIRDFALECFEALPEAAAVRRRHGEVFLALAEDAAGQLHGSEQARWLGTLEREHPNLRAALDWYRSEGETATALRLAAALWRFWQKTAVSEGQRRIDALLADADADTPPRLRSAALEVAGGLAYWRGDMTSAIAAYEMALTLEREIGEPAGIANTLHNIAVPLALSGAPERALEAAREALRLFASIDDEAGMVRARWGVGCVAYFAGLDDEAERELGASLQDAERIGDHFHANWARRMLGTTFVRLHRYEEARRHATAALRYFASVGDHSAIPLLLDDLSVLAAADGDSERQTRLAAASRALQQASGAELSRVSGLLESRLDVDREAFSAAWQEGLAMDEATAVDYALSGAGMMDLE